jgi:hypothetical protein
MAWQREMAQQKIREKAKELLANNRDMKQIKEFLEVDSVGYMSLEGLLSCAALPAKNYCTACWSGKYPIPVDTAVNKFFLEHYQMQMFDDWPQIKSELAVAVFDAVREAGMSFPFPQREVGPPVVRFRCRIEENNFDSTGSRGGDHHKDIEGNILRGLSHEPNSSGSENVGNLMGIGDYRGRAMGEDGPGEFPGHEEG